jgi:peroxiredoxin
MKIKFSFLWIILLIFYIQFVSANNLISSSLLNSNGYQITFKSIESKGKRVFLGNFYGKYNQYVDSINIDTNGIGVFHSVTKLSPGIYFIQDHRKIQLLDFIVAINEQHIVIEEINYETKSYKVEGGIENTLYSAYNEFVRKSVPKINQHRAELVASHTNLDSLNIQKKILSITISIDQYRANVIENNPNSLLAKYFIAMGRPNLPVPLPETLISQSSQLAYLKNHYWDGTYFTNSALIKTPFFETKIEDFLKYYISPTADSIIPIVDNMLSLAKQDSEMYLYLLSKFSNIYMNPAYLGQDKVFIHLYQNYYLKGDTILLNAKDKKTVIQIANKLIANQLGVKAPDFILIDTKGERKTLYGIEANYTFIIFWDPTCNICQKELPRFDSVYRTSWYQYGLKVITIYNEGEHENEWRKYLANHDLNEWVNLYEPIVDHQARIKKGLPTYQQLYNSYQTPTMYLLDKDKTILAKKLSLEQFDYMLIELNQKK